MLKGSVCAMGGGIVNTFLPRVVCDQRLWSWKPATRALTHLIVSSFPSSLACMGMLKGSVRAMGGGIVNTFLPRVVCDQRLWSWKPATRALTHLIVSSFPSSLACMGMLKGSVRAMGGGIVNTFLPRVVCDQRLWSWKPATRALTHLIVSSFPSSLSVDCECCRSDMMKE